MEQTKKPTFSSFLKSHNAKGNKELPITHTRIGDKDLNIFAGSYSIPDEKLPLFHELYYDWVFVKGGDEYLTEVQIKPDNYKMVVDLDFRYSYDVETRQHNTEHISEFVYAYLEEFKKYFVFDANTSLNVWVFHKPNVNRLEDKTLTKDGIHLVFDLAVPYPIQERIRETLITTFENNDNVNLPLTNSWDSVFDKGLSAGTCNWMLFGSQKPANQAYEITQHFKFTYDENDGEWMSIVSCKDKQLNPVDFETFNAISARTQGQTFQLKNPNDALPKQSKKSKTFKPISPSPTSVANLDNIEQVQKPKTVHQKLAEIKNETDCDKREKLLFFMENGFAKCSKSHDDIVKIGYALAKEFDEEGRALFLIFAEQHTSHDWDDVKAEYDKKYDGFLTKNNGNCSMGTIYWIFKKFDPKLYTKISKEFNFNHYKVDMIYNISFTGAVADYFKNLYGDFICSSNGIVYIYNGIRWKSCDDKNSELVRFIDKVFYKDLIEYGDNRMRATLQLLQEAETQEETDLINAKIKDISKYLGNVTFNMRNSGCRKGYMADIIDFSTNHELKFDANKFLFAFENKIYDLENKCFVEPDPSQYISKSCGYNYDDKYDTKYKIYLQNVINSVFPNKAIGDYYLTYLATGLSGIHMEEFMIATGVGGNGKSMINGLMMDTVGEYGYEIPSIALTKEIKDGPNPELARLDNIRFALTSEPDAKKKFCCATIKPITGNDGLAVRLLQSNKVGIDLRCSILCEANDVPDFDEVNQAVNRRVKAAVFETIAIDKSDYDKLDEDDKKCGKYTIKNPYYKTTEFKESHRQAFFMILCDYFEIFKNNEYALTEMPSKCKAKVVSLLAASDGIYSWFEELYEPVSKDQYLTSVPIPVSEIYDKFSSSTYFMRLPKTEQRKLNRKNFIEKITTNIFLQKFLKLRKTSWWNVKEGKPTQLSTDNLVGWILKPLDTDENDKVEEEK